jgi:hypothetical protein
MKILIILMSLLTFHCVQADDDAIGKVPERVDKEYQLIKAESVKFYDAEMTKCLKLLEKAKMEEARAGHLGTALAVDKMIKDIKEGKLLRDVQSKGRQLGRDSIEMIPLGATEVADGYEIRDTQSVRSRDLFSPPVDITYVVKTDSMNVRLGFAAEQIIFNWEVDHTTLMVVGGPADGMRKPLKGVIPVNQFVTIRQVLTDDEMKIFVNGEERGDWHCDFSKVRAPILVYQAYGSVVTLKDVSVIK